MRASSHSRAIVFALIGFTCWVTGDMFMKLAGEMPVPKYQIMGIAGFGGLISIGLITLCRGEIKKLRPRQPLPLCALGAMFLINYIVWQTALAHLPLANFYTVLFLAPTVVTIFAVLFLNETVTATKILAIIAGFVGVVIAVNPAHLLDDKSSWVSYGAALIGMLTMVGQMLTMRFLGNRENRENMAFYPRIAALGAGSAAMIVAGFEPMTAKSVAYSLTTGAIGGMGWLAMAHAYKLAPAATVAPFHYSQIITGGLFGYLIWHDKPSLHLLIGAAIIIASGIYIATHVRKAETLTDNP